MNAIPQIFDLQQLRRQRARTAKDFAPCDFLLREIILRLCERLDDTTRNFPQSLLLGCRNLPVPSARLQQVEERDLISILDADTGALSLPEQHYDLIFCSADLGWVNDLPGALIQLRRALKPDGLLLAMMYGGETLHELREALTAASAEILGGISPQISPFVDVRDAGSLLQRAGFSLPVVDSDMLTVTYNDPFALMLELRAMGEGNALRERCKSFTRRTVFSRAAQIYHERYEDEERRIPASFELVTLTAWAPHESQPKPLARGSGKTNLKDFLSQEEK